MKKLLAMLLALVMVLSLAACAGNEPAETPAEPSETQPTEPAEVAAPASYTYKSYSTALGSNWNPHTWETNGDSAVMGYIESPLCTMSILDSENGVYQWVMVAAESITDVTADNQADLTKYAVNLPEGQAAEETEHGFVFEIKLNPDMKWQDGTPINADTYIYSMQQLLAPEMKNYRANLYYSGESAVAGGASYYNAGQTVYLDNANHTIAAVADLTKGEDGIYVDANGAAVKIAVAKANEWLGGNSLADYVGAYGDAMFDVAAFDALAALADDEGLVDLTDETMDNLIKVITFSADWGESADNVIDYLQYAQTYPEFSYDGVGC